ncbi:MAG: carboxypeptidase regulatory-like domain-containing protein [Marichromatium sp.]|nr:carboxypeptidase regulatory-like domain-containing protein [Marichromatium sp.]
MRPSEPRVLLLALLMLCWQPAWAHRLNLFAGVEGMRISGSVYFSGGAPAVGVPIELSGGEVSLALVSDAEGRFAQTVARAADYRLVARTADGHRAEWRIDAAEFVAAPPPQAATQTIAPTPVADPALLAAIEQAVARQLRPLREELAAEQARVRLRDLLGGLGYILGLTGLALWWRARRG